MAGAVQSPRQKMINMMYLVLMAMLALNVSVDVLYAFWNINLTIEKTTGQLQAKNNILYQGIAEKFNNNPIKYKDIQDNAQEVSVASGKFYTLLESYKLDLLKKAGIIEEESASVPDEIESANELQSTQVAGEYFFPAGDINLGKGKEFQREMNAYRELLLANINPKNAALKGQIEQDFFTGMVNTKGGTKEEWIKNEFGHYPLAAAIAFLSQYQAKARTAESDVLTDMLAQLSENVALVPNTVEAIIIPEATTVLQGTGFKAQVMLAAYDNTQEPKVFLSGGTAVPVHGGKGMLSLPAQTLGDKKYSGFVRIKNDLGEETDYPFSGSYDVSAPSAVLAATKMNVLYRGLDNPVAASMVGFSSNDISVQGVGVTNLGGGNYSIDPADVRGATATYTIVAKQANGVSKEYGSFTYRIKNVPQPQGQVRGRNVTRLNKSALAQAKVEVVYPDFDFDIKTQVTGFSVKIPGKPAYIVNGDTFSPQAAAAVDAAAANTEVVIRDIEYRVLNYSKIMIKEASPVIVTLM